MKREQEGSKKVTEITLKKKLKVEIWYVLSVVAHGTSVKKKKKKWTDMVGRCSRFYPGILFPRCVRCRG